MENVIEILKNEMYWQDTMYRIGQMAIDKGKAEHFPYLTNLVANQKKKLDNIKSAITILSSKNK